MDLVFGRAKESGVLEFDHIVRDIMRQKVDAGIRRPNYPQVQDMITAFSSPMENHYEEDEPWVVKKRYAVIPEMFPTAEYAKEYYKETGEPLKLRVCVTGPLELYLKMVGNTIQEDLLMNVAKSVGRFMENAIIDSNCLETALFSIDEPSLGLNPSLVVSDDLLLDAWDLATRNVRGVDVEMHLHSVKALDRVLQAKKVNVLGVEYAANPRALDEIDRHEIESYDRFVRIGVSRTDITRMAGEYNQKNSADLWRGGDFTVLATDMETVRNITKRLGKAYEALGDRIRYAGPDCGIGSWPDQESAYLLLRNTAEAVREFNNKISQD